MLPALSSPWQGLSLGVWRTKVQEQPVLRYRCYITLGNEEGRTVKEMKDKAGVFVFALHG